MNWTEEDLRVYCERTGATLTGVAQPEAKKPSKYRNKRTEANGKTYDSKKEAKRAQELQLLVRAGEIAGVMEQVTFTLAGGVRYRADFVILNWDGTYAVEDVKGVLTKEYKIKKRLMAERGLEIKEV